MENEEYQRIVREYADIVFRVALSYTQTREDADDVLQTTFLKLLTKPVVFTDEDHIRRWLIRVAVNESHSLRASFWKKNVDYTEEIAEEPAFSSEDYSDLYEAVRMLPPKCRIVIHLFYYEGYATKEIAKLLHIREATVRTRLVRARKLLKQRICSEQEDTE